MSEKMDISKFEGIPSIDRLADKYFLSNARARRVLIFIVSISIIAFISFWDSRNNSWQFKRYEQIKKARMVFKVEHDSSIHLNIMTCLQKDSTLMVNTGLTLSEIEESKKYLAILNVKTLKDLDEMSEIFVSLIKESYIIKISWLGIHIDVNDLSVFSGLTFAFVLLVYYYTCIRELENLQIIKKLAEDSNYSEFYFYYLSMDQVLTLPPKDIKKRNELWQNVPNRLIFLPILVYFFIFINDLNTIKNGFALSESNSILLLTSSSVLMFFNIILTYMNYHLNKKLSKTWSSWHSELKFQVFTKKTI